MPPLLILRYIVALTLSLLGCGDNHHEPIVTFSDASPPDAMAQDQ